MMIRVSAHHTRHQARHGKGSLNAAHALREALIIGHSAKQDVVALISMYVNILIIKYVIKICRDWNLNSISNK